MVDTKISALTANSPLELANEFPINDAGATKKGSLTDLARLIGMTKTVLGSDYTNNSTTGTEVTGLSQTLVAGTYRFSFFLVCRSAATTTALDFGINYTGTITAASCAWRTVIGTTGAAAATGVADGTLSTATGNLMEHWSAVTESTTAPNMGAFTGVASANESFIVEVEGNLVCSDGGDLELWVASEVGSSTVTLMTGSNLIVIRF